MTPTAAEHPGFWTQMSKADEVHAANGWGSHYSQQARFTAYLRHVRHLLDPDDTLVDFGCGTGELADRIPKGVRYIGIDRNAGMRARARREHPCVTFRAPDDRVLPYSTHDHVVCLGAFNLAPYTLDDVASFVMRASGAARKSFAISVRARDGGGHGIRDEAHLTLDIAELVHIFPPCGGYVLDCSYSDHDALLVVYP